MRVCVYIDGFNLYYRALKGTPHKWLDVSKLSEALLAQDDEILAIHYFTADVSPKSGDPDAPTRQQAYLRTLRTIPTLSIHKGRFLPKTKSRPLVSDPSVFVKVHDTEEKGSDVNLATRLVVDGFRNHYDLALVISQDTDLLEPLRVVREELKKVVGLVWLDQTSPGKAHRRIASFLRHANPSVLLNSQFSNPVIGKGGLKIEKPMLW